MLAVLLDLAVCASIKLKELKNDKTPFDILYVDGSGETSITNNEGFYVAFKIHDGQSETFQKLTSSSFDEPSGHYRVSYFSGEDRNASCKQVKLTVNNYQETPLNISLGVFADAYFKTDNDVLSMALEQRAFQISGSDGSTVMLIVNGSNYPSVSSLYLGVDKDYVKSKDPSSYPYWDNSPGETTAAQDSVFAFSWQYQIIPPNSQVDFGFIVAPSTTYNSETFLRDVTNIYWGDLTQQVGDQRIYIEVIDYDPDDQINITLVWNHIIPDEDPETKEYKITVGRDEWDTKVSTIVYAPVRLQSGEVYEYSVIAKSLKDGYISSLDPVRVFAEGAQPPRIGFTRYPDNDYNPGDIIYVEGTIEDENKVMIFYQFDNGQAKTDRKWRYTFMPGEQDFFLNIHIPDYLELGKKHQLKIWVQDENFLTSLPLTHEFTYKQPDRPYIASVYLSDERIPKPTKHEMIIYGTGTDPQQGENISIMVGLDHWAADKASYFISTDKVETFAFYYDIETFRLEEGRHTLTIYLSDPSGHESRTKSVLSFLVYDPEKPLPPTEVGKIVDISNELPEDTNAAFNLKYVDTDGIPSEMTFNNEGFFVAFRTFPTPIGGTPSETQYLKHTNTYFQTKSFDNFYIYPTVINETATGYKRVQYRVLNNNDWPRKFELGIYADSDFSGDDNSKITIRPDQRGIVVTNVAKNLHYTVITKDVLDSPSVKGHYLKAVDRKGKEPLPLDKVPFFNTTNDVSELSNGNAMYGFHWSETIPAGEIVEFAVEFAGHDLIRTPPRVIDYSNLPESLGTEQKSINLSFLIKDGDVGENIRYNLTVNDQLIESKLYQNYESEKWVNKTVNITFIDGWLGDYFEYEFIAYDTEQGVGLKSNRIYRFAYVNHLPRITINPINSTYHNQSSIIISGTFSDFDTQSITLYYQFIDLSYDQKFRSMEQNLGVATPDFSFSIWGYTTNGKIRDLKIPLSRGIVSPRFQKWGILIYAKDSGKGKSNEVYFEFKLNPYDPPELKRAGLSKRYGTRGSTMLGYAIIKDKQVDDLYIYVKIDKDGQYPERPAKTIRNNEKTGEFKAVAFHWTVPQDATPGDHDVYICVRDSDGLEAEAKPVTFIVQN